MQFNGLNLDFLGHSGFFISNGKKIAIDPYNISNNVPKADIILISHSHYDHCSIKDIEKVAKKGSIVITTADCQSKIVRIEGLEMHIVEVGDHIDLGSIKIDIVPAYNVGKEYHPKSEGWIGFVIKMGKCIIYHAGDTDIIPEMQKLSGHGKHDNTFISLLPVSGTYVMDADEAAEVASTLGPDLAIPMHFGAGVAGTMEDAERFVELCKEKKIRAEILKKI